MILIDILLQIICLLMSEQTRQQTVSTAAIFTCCLFVLEAFQSGLQQATCSVGLRQVTDLLLLGP